MEREWDREYRDVIEHTVHETVDSREQTIEFLIRGVVLMAFRVSRR